MLEKATGAVVGAAGAAGSVDCDVRGLKLSGSKDEAFSRAYTTPYNQLV